MIFEVDTKAASMRVNCLGMLRLVRAVPLLVSVVASASLSAEVGRALRIDKLQCRALTCETREGWQPGLTTVEAEGVFRGFDALDVRVAAVQGRKLVYERKVGVMSNGKITISIPAYKYEDGEYVLVVTPVNNPQRQVAAGVFVKSTAAAPKEEKPAGNGGFAGKWYGTNGTMGLVTIRNNGTYDYNGAGGKWHANGAEIYFTGPLAAWNDGHGTLKNGVIEFYWKNAQGWAQWFTIQKVE